MKKNITDLKVNYSSTMGEKVVNYLEKICILYIWGGGEAGMQFPVLDFHNERIIKMGDKKYSRHFRGRGRIISRFEEINETSA